MHIGKLWGTAVPCSKLETPTGMTLSEDDGRASIHLCAPKLIRGNLLMVKICKVKLLPEQQLFSLSRLAASRQHETRNKRKLEPPLSA